MKPAGTMHGMLRSLRQVARAAGVLAVLLLVCGCTVSRQRIRKANAVIDLARPTQPTCARPNHCARSSPFLTQAHKAFAASTPGFPIHYVTLLDHGENAMAARINLVRAARRSIDVQNYIWSDDDIGKLMLDALVHAARRGITVRVLADQLFAFPDVEQLATLARSSANLHIRLYNPTFDDAETSPLQFAAGIVCCFTRFNQRMHNKLLLVDDAVGITGGRNYDNAYFGWSATSDFRDRDVVVAGPAAHKMADTFGVFWRNARSVPLPALRDVNRRILDDGPRARGWHPPHFKHPRRVARVRGEAANPDWLQQHLLAHSLRVGRVEYFSDYPAKTRDPHRKKAHQFTLHIMRMVAGAKKQIVLQTPYLVLSHRARHLFELMHQRPHPPRVIASTNSLASTDAFVSYAMTYKHMKRFLTKYGFEIYELKPHPDDAAMSIAPPPGPAIPIPSEHGPRRDHELKRYPLRPGKRRQPAPLGSHGPRVSLHAKSIVVDDRFAMVGTHNFDPRSDHYNTESGVIVHSKRFAHAVRTQILHDTLPGNAWTVAPRQQDIPLLSGVNNVISTVSAHLPWFDLWPFRYATLYQLKPGCRQLVPGAPGFYECYRSVGDFPGVKLPFKTIYTRLVTGFGFGIGGIL